MPAMKPPALDPADVAAVAGSNYPQPFKSRVAARRKQRLGDALGLKNFGVNLTTIPPGAVSALRHWHSHEDEFIYIVSGELNLVTNDGEQRLTPGMCAGFPAGKADGHCLVNRAQRDAVLLADLQLHHVVAVRRALAQPRGPAPGQIQERTVVILQPPLHVDDEPRVEQG